MTYHYSAKSPLARKIDSIIVQRRNDTLLALQAAIQARLEATKAQPKNVVVFTDFDRNRRRSYRIMKAGCVYFGIPVDQIRSISRTGPVSFARQVMMYVAYTECYPVESLPRIGRLFKKDHTTVLFAVKKMDSLYDECDERVVAAVDYLRGVK